MEVLTRILSLLDQKKKQQKDLADFLGINKNNITDWKSGKSKSYNKYLYQIAAYLNTTPEYLKGETDISSNTEPENEQKKDPAQMSREEKKSFIMQKYFQMTEENQKTFEQFVDYLLETQEKTPPDDSANR